jgi:hypothetical protein
MGLVHAGITAGQLGYGDGHEDHEEAGGEILIFCLTLQLVNRILENIVSAKKIIHLFKMIFDHMLCSTVKKKKYCKI